MHIYQAMLGELFVAAHDRSVFLFSVFPLFLLPLLLLLLFCGSGGGGGG